jgi:hypothetical protein
MGCRSEVVSTADGGDNVARSSEANLRDVKLVRPVESRGEIERANLQNGGK